MPNQVKSQQYSVSFQVFYDQLSPYGQWVDYPNYGYVWIPDAGPDFVPYASDGYWVNTDYGWTWVSDYEWGWAPFHYGRWDYSDYYGWLWVPDNEWGPSWVTWRRAEGYYGWTPMAPGVSIEISLARNYNHQTDHWIFVRDQDFERPHINRYFVDRNQQARIINNSTVINTTYIDNSRNTTYITGPGREEVQRATGRKVNHIAIQENNKPGQQLRDGQMNIYRPRVERHSEKAQKPAPSKITNIKDVKRPAERNILAQPNNQNPAQNTRQDKQAGKVAPKGNNKATPLQPRTNEPNQRNNSKKQAADVKSEKRNKTENSKKQNPTLEKPSGNEPGKQQPNVVEPEKNKNPRNVRPQNTNPAKNKESKKSRKTTKPRENGTNDPEKDPR